MATLLHSDSRRLYSWWWDSHISPKNSKWLQENLTDMDAKVKAMIKLIEEDADSFARRAEMYYKKRPELMKLVEEFYRAYRALAERYDHATVELRQAHRTMVEAFPNQVPFSLPDDATEGEPHVPELPNPIHALLNSDELHKLGGSSANGDGTSNYGGFSEESESGVSKRGLKQLYEIFGSGESQASKAADRKMKKGLKAHEGADGEMETEVQNLKKILSQIKAEKDSLLFQYQESLQKLSNLERELKEAEGLEERASRAEIEIKVLKENLAKLEGQRDAGLLQYNRCLDQISRLEKVICRTEEDSRGLNERAIQAETEAQILKQGLSDLEAEKEAGLSKYNHCLQMITILEKKIALAEENARLLNEQSERAETEIKALKQALATLSEEKEAVELRYKQCLDRIAEMGSEISNAHKDVDRLNHEILAGLAKLKAAEEQCFMLEMSNRSLQLEADELAQRISVKDQELKKKESDLDKLQNLLKDEQSRIQQLEASLQTLQKLHSESQEKQRALASEHENMIQNLKDLELRNLDLNKDLHRAKEENQNLNELNSSSSTSIMNLQNEIASLKESKEKLKQDIGIQVSLSNSLQQEIQRLKAEIEDLNRRHQELLQQVLSTGLNPEGLVSSIKDLQDENLKLHEVTLRDREEKEALHEKLRDMNKHMEKNVALERSLSELNRKLEGSSEKVKELKDSCQFLQGEKSGLSAEKSMLLSQLQMMTENMQKLLEKIAMLEGSLSSANNELEGLRMKSKSLEEICEILKNEKSNLANERSSLVSQLANVEQRLGNLEIRFTRLEEKYTDLEKEKESTLVQVKELQGYLGIEKQERVYYVQSSESRLVDLEKQVNSLQEERRLNKNEFEEELDKAVKSQVEIFVLQKFIQDLEAKNLSLCVEYQKYVEASKLSNKVISELETENLEQQVEVEFLLDEIEKLRMDIHHVFRALQFDQVDDRQVEVIEEGQVPLVRILHNIETLKSSLLMSDDAKQQLVVENSVLLTLIGELRSEGVELGTGKEILEEEFQIMSDQCDMLQRDKSQLMELNKQLRSELSIGELQQEALKSELQTQHSNLESLQCSYLELQEENNKALGENKALLQTILELKEDVRVLDEENNDIIKEALTFSTLSTAILFSGIEKAEELQAIYEDLNHLRQVNGELKLKVESVEEKLRVKEAETEQLNLTIEGLKSELHESRDLTDVLNVQLLVGQDFLRQQTTELLEARQKLEQLQKLNAEFCRTIEELKNECKESKAENDSIERHVDELSEDCFKKEIEIKRLHEANENMESEMSILRKEVEERRAREESLSLELQEKSNEFELWEAEASSFYFDFQVSSIREVLLENKVLDLTAVCENLEDENATKTIEIEDMRQKHTCLESEIKGLKGQLSAYVPVISSLNDSVQSLQRNVLLHSKLVASLEQASSNQRETEAMKSAEPRYVEVKVDESAVAIDAISDLLDVQSRIKAIETAVVEEVNALVARKEVAEEMSTQRKTVTTDIKQKGSNKGAALLKSRSRSRRDHRFNYEDVEIEIEPSEYKSQKKKTEILMKDIPLDEVSDRSSFRRNKSTKTRADDTMLKMWESVEQDSSIESKFSYNKPKHSATLSEIAGVHRRFRGSRKKSRGCSLELQIEKEVGVDKLELPVTVKRETNHKGKILERLASDTQKLASLQTAVQDLKKKMESKKKTRRAINLEFEEVKKQLQEVEEAVMQLSVTNDQLKKGIEHNPLTFDESTTMGSEEAPPGNAYTKKVTEQARKGAEQIGRLQFEVQSIEYILLKLEDENKSQGRYKFPGTKTGIVLRDFIQVGRTNSRRRKKGCFCGCSRLSAYED